MKKLVMRFLNWWTPVKTGILLSALVLALLGFLASLEVCRLLPSFVLECRTNLEWFLDSPPNEIGDTLAGFAGTLAFIWIVATVWLQSIELREQRAELADQRAATQDMARSMAAQARVFEDEQRQRYENRSKEELDRILPWLAPRIAHFANVAKARFGRNGQEVMPRPIFSHGNWNPRGCKEEDISKIVSDAKKYASEFLSSTVAQTDEEWMAFSELFVQIEEDIGKALKLRDTLSGAEAFRLDLTQLAKFAEVINDVEGRFLQKRVQLE